MLIDMVRNGKHPLVQFSDAPKCVDESFAEKDMIARVVSAGKSGSTEDSPLELGFDYSEHKAHNLALQDNDWFIYDDNNKVGLGTAVEAGFISEDDLTEAICLEDSDAEIPVVFISGLALEFALSDLALAGTYVEFLEQKIATLIEDRKG